MAAIRILADNPSYALMRAGARFATVRALVTGLKAALRASDTERRQKDFEARISATMFPQVDRHRFLADLRAYGCSFGLELPTPLVQTIRQYADTHPVYAFRDEKLGFMNQDRLKAEAALGREILLAQYFNCERDCPAIGELAEDPLLGWVALNYLGSRPRFLGCNLWWTYPITPKRADQLKHAHCFHRDVDDFRFLKFFFYLTDVREGDGAHWIVRGSHRKAPNVRFKDRFLLRRYEDAEVAGFYPSKDILEIVGSAGEGFAEDTLCVHKAASPTAMPRLILQLQYALFDLGVGDDSRAAGDLQMIQV